MSKSDIIVLKPFYLGCNNLSQAAGKSTKTES